MDRYYYIASQLPFLQLTGESEYNQEKFFAEAKKWLSSKDYQQLKAADVNNTKEALSDFRIVRQYKEFEKSLRKELTAWRKAKQEGYEHKTTLVPQNILKESNPLEIEVKLLQLRWDYLEELGLDHYFDMEFLLLYNYKLQLLKRIKSFDKDRGMEKYKQYTEVGI
jgi:hypothetical protein